MILFSLFTVFFTGFLILELQVRQGQSNWQTIISFFTNLCLAMGWLIDKGTWILPVSQLHSKGFTCNYHSNFWRSLPQSRGVAKWHGWVYNYFWEWVQDQVSNVLENYRTDESFEEHFVLKLILVSTVLKFPIHPIFIYPSNRSFSLNLYKGISNFNVA